MNIETLRQYCLSKPGAEEDLPFGPDTLVFKVGGKMFLLAGLDNVPLQFNAKCDPDEAELLREQYSCVQPGYHMNKKHWNTVEIEGLPDIELCKMIDHSYDLVVQRVPRGNRFTKPRAVARRRSAIARRCARC